MGISFRAPSQKFKTSRLIVLAILFAVAFRNMGLSIIDIGLPSFILNLSGSLISFGMVVGIFSVMQSLFQFPIAACSDKYGRKPIMLIGIIIYALGTFLCYFSQDIFQLIIFRAIQGIGAYTSILQAIIGEIFVGQHGKGMGYYSLALNIGYFGGIILGGYVSSFLGFRSIFLINGILIILSAIFLISFFKKHKQNVDIEKEFFKSENKSENDFSLNRQILYNLFRTKEFSITVFLNCIRWFIFGSIVVYLIWVLQVPFAQSEITSSYMLILIVAVYVGFVIVASKVLDKYGPRKMMLLGQIIVLIMAIPFLFQIANFLWIFLITTSFMSMGLALYDPAGNTLLLNIIDESNPDLKGSGIGINNALGFFFSSLSPMIVCPLGEIDVFLPFYLLIGLVFIALIVTIKFL
jgi:MFS family permease